MLLITMTNIELPPRKRGGFLIQRPLPIHDNSKGGVSYNARVLHSLQQA
jgi:hypothetical protein